MELVEISTLLQLRAMPFAVQKQGTAGLILGVKWNKSPLFYPFQLRAGLGDKSGFLLCAWTTKKPN